MNGKPLPPVQEIPFEERAKGFPILALFKPPYFQRMIILLLYWLLFYTGDYAYLGEAPTILIKQGFGLASSIGFSAISAIGFIVGSLYIIWFGDRVERKISLIVSGIIGGALIILAGIWPTPVMVVIAGFFFTVEIALLSTLGYVITAEHFPTRARSSGLAMDDGIGHFGGAIAPIVALAAVAHWGILGGYGLMGITTFAALFFMGMTSRATRKNLESINDDLSYEEAQKTAF